MFKLSHSSHLNGQNIRWTTAVNNKTTLQIICCNTESIRRASWKKSISYFLNKIQPNHKQPNSYLVEINITLNVQFVYLIVKLFNAYIQTLNFSTVDIQLHQQRELS